MSTTLTLPALGESVIEATIGKWHVKEGDRVEKDQPIVEVLTDKADSELPAPTSGRIAKILAAEGATVPVGTALCEIEAGAEGARPSPVAAAAPAPSRETLNAVPAPVAPPNGPSAAAAADVPSSPSARKLAREHGVDLRDVAAKAQGGRVTKDDVLRAASGGQAAQPSSTNIESWVGVPTPAIAPNAPTRAGMKAPAFQPPPYVPKPGDEKIPFTRRRRIIADHMVYSKLTSPHVVTVAEVDLHRTAKLRDAHKDELKKQGINLTFLAFVAAATTRALREFRDLNARVLEDAYVLLREINLGIAVDTPEGLIVPVVRNADELSIRGLARGIDEIARKARDNKLMPDDLAGKTFVISNPGRRGNLYGGAIISQPNVGILRTGEIIKRVVVVERDGEDLMAIHPVMHMALSYDHRIVDGVNANGFLYRVREILETGDFEV